MTEREQYTPGPARGAQVRKDGAKWTLILVRDLRHAPEKVWQALTDPAHLREWAPFDADGSLGTAGATVKLTTVGAPTPQVSETRVTRADAPRMLEYNWWFRCAMGTRSYKWGHAPDAVDHHRPALHLNGCCRMAHLSRCAGSFSQQNPRWPHRWSRCGAVRGLAEAQCGIRPAIRYRSSELVPRSRPTLRLPVSQTSWQRVASIFL